MMESRAQKAVDYYVKSGYNCAQAIVCTYADLLELDPLICFKAAEAFGTGMGCRLATCGAISGAMILVGFKKSTGNLDDDKTNKSKVQTCELGSKIVKDFYEMNQTVTCKDLKDPKSGMFHSCLDCIRDVALLVEKHVFEGTFESCV